jgi:hypothetical protein
MNELGSKWGVRGAEWLLAFALAACAPFACNFNSSSGNDAGPGAVMGDGAAASDASEADSTTPDAGDATGSGSGDDAAAAPDVVDAGTTLDAPAADSSSVGGDAGRVCTDAGVDDAGQGFCGGVRIGILGAPGANTSSNFQAWLASNGQIVMRVPMATTVDATLLSGFDVVILDQLQRTYATGEADALRDWVAAGGGVMSMSGYTGSGPDRAQPNTLLASIGLQYVTPLSSGPVTMFVDHPTTTGLTSVTFEGGYLVGAVDGGTGGNNTVTASLTAGPVGMAQERGAGRVYVWGDEWVEYDSEWQSMPQIRQYWIDVLGWLERLR